MEKSAALSIFFYSASFSAASQNSESAGVVTGSFQATNHMDGTHYLVYQENGGEACSGNVCLSQAI